MIFREGRSHERKTIASRISTNMCERSGCNWTSIVRTGIICIGMRGGGHQRGTSTSTGTGRSSRGWSGSMRNCSGGANITSIC